MDTLILKLIMDVCFYMAIFMPLLNNYSGALRWGLAAVPVLWAFWLAANWKKRKLVEMVRYNFFMEFRILCVVQIFEVLFLRLAAWRSLCVPFLTGFAVSGVLLMRSGRLEGGDQGKESFWKANGAEIFLVSAIAFLFSRNVVSESVTGFLGHLYNLLIFPVLRLFLEIFIRLVMWIMPLLKKLLPELSYEPQEMELAMGGAAADIFGEVEMRETPAVFKYLGIGICLLVLFLFLRFLYRRLSERGGMGEERTAGQISRSRADTAPKKKSNRNIFSGERNVRYYYRRFLELCSSWGIEVAKGAATSERIGKSAVESWGMEEELSRMREIYLRVRYGGQKESKEERRQVKETYKAVKEKIDSIGS